MNNPVTHNDGLQRSEEIRSAVFLAVVLAPILSVLVVAGYGFLVWIYQLFAGPPGPMGG